MEPWHEPTDVPPKCVSGPFVCRASTVTSTPRTGPPPSRSPEKIGCTAETLRRWNKQAEIDSGERDGASSAERMRLVELEKEVRELKRANEILRKASKKSAPGD